MIVIIIYFSCPVPDIFAILWVACAFQWYAATPSVYNSSSIDTVPLLKVRLSGSGPIACVLLGAFAKLRKSTLSLAMSVRPSVLASICPSVRTEQLGSHWMDFHEMCYLNIFRKSVDLQDPLKSDKNIGYFTWRPVYIFFIIPRSVLPIMKNVSNRRCRWKRITHFMFNNFFFRKSCQLWDNIEIQRD